MEVFAVVWGSGSCDDHGNAHACTGVHGIYTSEESAKTGLVECHASIYEDAKAGFDPDDEGFMDVDIAEEIKVYGSVEEGYFEIDYTLGTEPVEIRVEIVKTQVQG